MISKREMSCIAITSIIASVSIIVAFYTVGWDIGRLVSGEKISIVGYSFVMTVGLFFGHLNEIIAGNTSYTQAGLDEIGIFLGLAMLTFASIPLMIKFSKGINIIRRIPYVWISGTQLSFMALLYIGMLK